MTSITRALADHFRTHHGVASIDTMVDHGLTLRQIRSLAADGLLVRVHRTVYRHAANPDTLEARCVAACAAHPALAITARSAGRLWGFRRVPPSRVVTATAPLGDAPSLKGVALRRSSQLPAGDLVHRPDGIRVVSPVRTLFDLAPHVTDEAFESITEEVLDRFCSVGTLLAGQARYAGRGRPGAARINRVIGSRPAWQPPADSDLELRVLLALEARGVLLERQFMLTLAEGDTIHLDGADPALRWGVEIDHVTWHGGRVDAQRDKIRDRRGRLVGWQIERVTDQELATDFDRVIDQLVALHRRRAADLAA